MRLNLLNFIIPTCVAFGLSFGVIAPSFAATKIIKLKNSTPEQIVSAISIHLDKDTKLSVFKNQLIISADEDTITKTIELINSLEANSLPNTPKTTPEDFYNISFLTTKFPISNNSFATNQKVYTVQTGTKKTAKVYSSIILPITKVSKKGAVSKEFKLFDEGFMVKISPKSKDLASLDFSLLNQTNVNKQASWNQDHIISSIQAPFGFWQLVAATKTSLTKADAVNYSNQTANYFYVCVEKLQNSTNCKVK